MTLATATIAERVQQLVDDFAQTASARDKAGGTAKRERDLLRQSGLLSALFSESSNKGSVDWQQVLDITRTLARVDSSLAHLFGYHYLCVATVDLYGSNEQLKHLIAQTKAANAFWGNAFNPLDQHVTATKTNGGWLVNGTKHFCSGASDSDYLLLSAHVQTNDYPLIAVIPTKTTGVEVLDDWDSFGQRQTDSGSVTFTDVFVNEAQALQKHHHSEHYLYATCRTHIAQSILLHVLLGTAEGAFDAAKAYTKQSTRPWVTANVTDATEDPYIIRHYGELYVQLQAADALLERAVTTLVDTLALKHNMTFEQRGACSIAIATAKIQVVNTTLDVTSKMFQLMGARATSAQYNFDRYWRNVRTHTLHDPIDYKIRDVGQFALHDRYPQISAYS